METQNRREGARTDDELNPGRTVGTRQKRQRSKATKKIGRVMSFTLPIFLANNNGRRRARIRPLEGKVPVPHDLWKINRGLARVVQPHVPERERPRDVRACQNERGGS